MKVVVGATDNAGDLTLKHFQIISFSLLAAQHQCSTVMKT